MNTTAIRAGFHTTVQDLGRAGLREFGVSLGGALDSHALRVANLLAGNEESAAGLETTFGGLRLRFVDERVVVWCGGEFDVRVGSASIAAGRPAFVGKGEELSIAAPVVGCRAWIAISGGVDVPLVLGSRSANLRSGFGGIKGRPIRDGEEFSLGQNPIRCGALIEKLRARRSAPWKAPHQWANTARPQPVLRYLRGADCNRFDFSVLESFKSAIFLVSPDSDRMGARLDGPRLKRNDESDLLSEAVAPGTIQVPPSGQPILLLNDCQTIGGYPKLAHVISTDLALAAQLRPGDRVRFVEVSLADAHRLWCERERDLEQFRRGLELHFT